MKGSTMIKIIQDNHLEDFDLEFVISNVVSERLNVDTYNIEELCDIGNSSNEVSFTGDKK